MSILFRFFLSGLFATMLLASSASAGQKMDFAVIHPGQPGSAREARPVMESLAAYLSKKLDGAAMAGDYYNEVEPACRALGAKLPVWGIVSLGFYAQYAKQFPMTPIAATRPGGRDKDNWRLVARSAADSWKKLDGEVMGTMLFLPETAAKIVFKTDVGALPFRLTGTDKPLKALRNVARGKLAGALLDADQYQALSSLPQAQHLKVLLSSGDIPTSPVVWFGRPGLEAESLAKALMGMRTDPEADGLNTLLLTQGFGPPDPNIGSYRLGAVE